GDIGIITFDQAIETVDELKEDLDTITLYLNPQRQEAYYDFIIKLAPKRVIFNPGTENPVFYKKLQEHNIEIDVACTLVLLGTDQY
ncbi:CoA-binding protein, partial [Dokdonia donghaensis]|uniref:CoA-binding protein n=1 Tax=Dokdonia donghaensis TaxID=326320 RepID=UPI0035C83F0D